jgi:hypothetical protein
MPAGDPMRTRGSGGESAAHRELKVLALRWAAERGLPIGAMEVRVPRSSYRADAAAATRRPSGDTGRIALFECKQARADLLRDDADEPEVRRELASAGARLHALREAIGVHRPDLRRGDGLFPEFEELDLRGLRHATLEQLEAAVDTGQRRLLRAVKFARLRRYRAADHLYLVTVPGVLEPAEVPVGWGWLERAGDGLVLRRPPERHPTAPEARLAWLEAIALAASPLRRVSAGADGREVRL